MLNVLKPNINKAAASPEEEQQRNRKVALMKLLAILIFFVLVIVFGSLAWFASNRQTTATGMGATIGSDAYQIVPLDGRDSIYAEFMDLIPGNSSDGFLPWKMAPQNKMDNYDSEVDAGIRPVSYGTLSFYVKPSDTYIDLDLTFEILGYKYESSEVSSTDDSDSSVDSDDSEDEAVINESMTPVSDELQGYLTGHILLFESRDIKTVDGKEVILYSDPILPDANGKRKMTNRRFQKADENKLVNVYWVWAETLSKLVNSRSNINVSAEPFCVDDPAKNDDSYDKIVKEILNNPVRYFYQYDTAKPIYAPDAGKLSAELIAEKYDIYGDQYDRVDNEIGMYVDYITLKMETKMSQEQENVPEQD